MDFTTCFGHAIENLIVKNTPFLRVLMQLQKRFWPQSFRAQWAGWMGIGRKDRGEKKVFHAIEGTVRGLKVD